MQTYSRRQNVEAKENKRRAIGFVLLSVAIVAFMFYFGLPLLARISNFAYDLRGSGEPIRSGDTTPPPPPRFDELPEFTNSDKIEVRGYSEPGATVTVFINNKREEVLVNNEGRFTREFNLLSGKNTIYATSKDSSGNESRESASFEVNFDKEPPEIEIVSPKNGDVFSGARARQTKIEGTTEKDAKISINGHLSIVDSEGKFSYFTNLAAGENKFVIKSEDQAGNSKEQELTVTYYP